MTHYLCDSFLGNIDVDAFLSEKEATLIDHQTVKVSAVRGDLSEPVTTHRWRLFYSLGSLFLGDLSEYDAREAAALYLYLLDHNIPSCLASTIAIKTIEWHI